MEGDDLAALLALGVDGLRLALHAREEAASSRAELGEPPRQPPSAEAELSPPPELAALRQQYAVRFRLDALRPKDGSAAKSHHLELVNERVIGKICWPAAEALASYLLASDGRSDSQRVLLELGAGCALPSLAAALTGAFGRVVATDMTPERVAIATRNAELNGLSIETAEVLFADYSAIDAIVGSAHAGCTLCAADVHYNPEALVELVESCAALMRARADRAAHVGPPPPFDELLLARSAMFAHNDELMLTTAAAQGLVLASTVALRTGGVLHAASPTLFEPNPNDSTDIFRFALPPLPVEEVEEVADGP